MIKMEKVKGALGRLGLDFSKKETEIYTALKEDEEMGNVKYHLRVVEDGQGTLTINADKVIYLNITATDLIRLWMEDASDEEIIREGLQTVKQVVSAHDTHTAAFQRHHRSRSWRRIQ